MHTGESIRNLTIFGLTLNEKKKRVSNLNMDNDFTSYLYGSTFLG